MKSPRPATAVALSLILTGCAVAGGGSSGPQTLSMQMGDGFDNLDPALSRTTFAGIVQKFVYDTLVTFEPGTRKLTSSLASSWEFTATTAKFTLNPKVTCSDGTPFTAATVKRNLDRIKDPATASPTAVSIMGSTNYDVTADDKAGTVSIKYAAPVVMIEARLVRGPFMVCDSGLDRAESLKTTPLGTGPYTLTEGNPGAGFTFAKRKDYTWGPASASTTSAAPDTVKIDFSPDSNATANLLLGGQRSIGMLGGQPALRVSNVNGMQKAVASQLTLSLLYNVRNGSSTSDPAVRKALQQLVSAKDWANVVGPAGSAAESRLPEGAACSPYGKVTDILPPAGVPAATKTMTDAGYAKDASGIWAKGGQPVTVRLAPVETTDVGAEFLRNVWASFGFKVEVNPSSTNEKYNTVLSGRGWDVTALSIGAERPTYDTFGGSEPAERGQNLGGVHDQAYDSLVAQAAAAGPEGGCDLWIKAERRLVELTAFTPLSLVDTAYYSSKFRIAASGPYLAPTAISAQ
ncbi:peptide/nickel transport system substrate-binding protein [Kibdelosporangium banguiense]|uniref:Peptide/nickel transport system substrate-binding protein n=1 Tax=Kibdelosporangium banguiense TaxID=1365924 RepID=A0ABS4TYA1_9PSEU|nr:ABC transporter substrate-binding protein [Kibdelosporangium banguiense]MBP2328959.1 peptide/nickel transport system substrate-binding protein [Kibdelosporangium banguiense]